MSGLPVAVVCRGWATVAAGRSMTTVSPPPGVGSAVTRPVHGFGESAGDGQAQPHAVTGRHVTHPLEGFEDPAQGSCGYARAVVDHPETDVHGRRRGRSTRTR